MLQELPLSNDLLKYYREKLETFQTEHAILLEEVERIRVEHSEHHKTQWQLHKVTNELADLQIKLSDNNKALFDERKNFYFNIVQELKDRKKIRYLLATTGLPEEEITYLKDNLSKKVVKISNTVDKNKNIGNQKSQGSERDLIILEDEIEALKLELFSCHTQLDEQKEVFQESISNLIKDRNIKDQEEAIRREHGIDNNKIADLLKQVERLRSLTRENTRELLQTKKDVQKRERNLVEEKILLIQEINDLKKNLTKQEDRAVNAEKTIEIKVTKKQETLVNGKEKEKYLCLFITIIDLRNQLGKHEEELRTLRTQYDEMEIAHKKRHAQLVQRAEQVASSYVALRKRRDYEIEGFTNDIKMLRKQLRNLEKSVLKYGPLEDKELTLLDIARQTGLKAEKIASTLSDLKSKVYSTENKLSSLAF
ncbi:Coiled-coil domain-containing protein 77 [Clydaea vesicula]|uniref:Coiled-coil domain-containing protein 77 n=1 Tax=Clydaea vesicula TaxID=447962 RepID=A0AAD5XX60_9FUNG|nr:Coiled-coil domain-containing protein 77 [Clydaea vesicula]